MTSSARCVCVLSLSFQLRTVSLVYDDEQRLQPLENALLLLLLFGFLVMTSYLGIITWLLKVLFFCPSPLHADVLPCTSRGPASLRECSSLLWSRVERFYFASFQASLSTSSLLSACSWREKHSLNAFLHCSGFE